ncbi:hypothetical protein Sjap_019793 [Stephania japonica]|uniref:Uncharacterized protein n=1 Tax=Stephania japonica TaxID=461633 RepID=A0AAP0I027_9MAGN
MYLQIRQPKTHPTSVRHSSAAERGGDLSREESDREKRERENREKTKRVREEPRESDGGPLVRSSHPAPVVADSAPGRRVAVRVREIVRSGGRRWRTEEEERVEWCESVRTMKEMRVMNGKVKCYGDAQLSKVPTFDHKATVKLMCGEKTPNKPKKPQVVLTGVEIDLAHVIASHIYKIIKKTKSKKGKNTKGLPYANHLYRLFDDVGLKSPPKSEYVKVEKSLKDVIGELSMSLIHYKFVDGKWVNSGKGKEAVEDKALNVKSGVKADRKKGAVKESLSFRDISSEEANDNKTPKKTINKMKDSSHKEEDSNNEGHEETSKKTQKRTRKMTQKRTHKMVMKIALMGSQSNQPIQQAMSVNSPSSSLIQNQIDALGKVVHASINVMMQEMKNLNTLVDSPKETSTYNSNQMSELKIMVQTSITHMESKVRSMVKDILKELEVAIRINICQNYNLLDICMGRLEQLINSQGPKLRREVSQILLQFSRGNEA